MKTIVVEEMVDGRPCLRLAVVEDDGEMEYDLPGAERGVLTFDFC